MGRGCGGGGGRRSSFRGSSTSTKAIPRAAPATTPPAAAKTTKNTSSGSNESFIGSIGSAFFHGWGWSMGYEMVQRGMDAVFGPRTVNVVDATPPTASSPAPAAAAHPMLDACGAHKKAFQECVAQQRSDVSRCQPYLDMLNDCRRDSAASAAAGVGTTTTIL